MIVTILGCLIFAVSILQIRFPDLAVLLKSKDPATWEFLGAPSGFSFADLGNTLSLFSWVLSKKFLDSNNPDIVAEGQRAHIKARRVRYGLILGLVIMVAGLAMALVQSFA
ncbi:hypothetical protein ACNKU7_18750 [Microbulbifer sp. SA54]|uniref:hypothetical protein n=1 Tax=Microbulbifer sp. SA54 TaxID=3401577 RepID=UPI003AAB694C